VKGLGKRHSEKGVNDLVEVGKSWVKPGKVWKRVAQKGRKIGRKLSIEMEGCG